MLSCYNTFFFRNKLTVKHIHLITLSHHSQTNGMFGNCFFFLFFVLKNNFLFFYFLFLTLKNVFGNLK